MQTVNMTKFQAYNLVRFLKSLPADEIVSIGGDIRSVIRCESTIDEMGKQNFAFERLSQDVVTRQEAIVAEVGKDESIDKNKRSEVIKERFEAMEQEIKFHDEREKPVTLELSDEKMALVKNIVEKGIFKPCFVDSNNRPSCYFLDKGFAVKLCKALGIEE